MYEDVVTQSGISHGRLFQQTHRVSVKALRRSVWAFLVPLVAIAMLLTAPAYAQTLYGTLVGNVTDSTGAAVVGAMVVATDVGTGIAKTVTTDGSGAFRLSDLGAGTYKVSISAKAFASTVGQGIEIQANTERRFDAQLHPATVGQTVMVTAAPPELQTDTANVTSELETDTSTDARDNCGIEYAQLPKLVCPTSRLFAAGRATLGSGEPRRYDDVQRKRRVGKQQQHPH